MMLVCGLVLLTTAVIVCAHESHNGGEVLIESNVWEGSCNPRNPLFCRRRGCPLPPFPQRGEYQIKDPRQRLKVGTFAKAGTILVYFCDDNYEPSDDLAVCLSTGDWSATPECQIRHKNNEPCTLPAFPKSGSYYIQSPNVSATVGEPIGTYTILLYTCELGFELSKNISICLGGEWSADPQCVPIKDTRCILPLQPMHGSYYITPRGYFTSTPGQFVSQYTILEYICDYGYESVKSVIICGDNNRWSGAPVCEVSTNSFAPNYTLHDGCKLPAKPEHGLYAVVNYDEPLIPGELILPYTVLNFYCEDNYEPSNVLAVCMQNKSWSSNVTCRKSCTMMSSRSVNFVCLSRNHSRVACAQFAPHGSTVHPFCREGYSPIGQLNNMRCQDGKWDKSTPECQPVEGSTSSSWNFGIFQEFGGNVLPMCVFLEGQIAIRVPQTIAQTNNQQRPANYYTFEGGKFYKLPDNQLEQAIFDSSAEDTIQGIAKPGKGNKPKKPKRPSTTTPNEIFPSLSPNNPDSADPPPKSQSKCKTICDNDQIFGDFVASTLRNFNSDQNKRKLKLGIQELILEATKDDDYLSFVFSPDTTGKTATLVEEESDSAYNPKIDKIESPSGINTH